GFFSASGNYWTQTGSHTTTPWDAFKPTLKCASNKQLKHVLAVIAAKNTLYQENIWQWRPQLALLAQIEQDVKNAMKKPKK
ncbi:MAG: hypothetical protein M1549_00945, partial [Candidatus Dependentiae bacterium]|nr:hypothetical protein [Candidatus Dependentiae bacterium]